MANEDKKFDDLFKSKLSNHEIIPAALAWERLEGKLNRKGKAAYFPFLRIAASIVLLLGVGYIAWFISKEDTKEEQPQIAEVIEKAEETALIQQELAIEENSETIRSTEMQKHQVASQNVTKTDSQKGVVVKAKEVSKQDFITEFKPIEKIEVVVALPELKIPELDLNVTVAVNLPIADEIEEEVAYKITIIGKGIDASEPAKVGLIDEIENKVEKISGLLNKVDQGFADLQDAKNNLFSLITARKERSK